MKKELGFDLNPLDGKQIYVPTKESSTDIDKNKTLIVEDTIMIETKCDLEQRRKIYNLPNYGYIHDIVVEDVNCGIIAVADNFSKNGNLKIVEK